MKTLAGLLACAVIAVQPAPAAESVNVRDFGASGSKFEAKAVTAAGSNVITAARIGDFKAGQGVMVSKASPRITEGILWGPHSEYAKSRPLKDIVQIRGYDGSQGSWVVFVLDVPPRSPHVFRWTDDLGRTWHEAAPITGEWQPLAGGIEVRFGKLDWEAGYTATLVARDQLVTTIEKIDGTKLTLKDAPTRSVKDAVVRHCDDTAIQAAVDRAIKEKQNVFFPIGQYRLSQSIRVQNASAITLEGQSATDTVLDISEGKGACISLKEGTEVTLRNFRMLGQMGFDGRDQAGLMRTQGGTAVWGFYFKHCNGVGISGTERVLVENCHASRMSAECFYSQGRGRRGLQEPKAYTKSITYERCSVTDCARNAFNNNDHAENTSVLHCRIVDVGGCSWEGASRFVRFIGNYVRNAGTVAMGNIRSRADEYETLPSGQHLIADNVFESFIPYGGCAIRASAGAQQVIIRNNLFVNFGSSAVELSSATGPRDLPAAVASVTGNLFDMTEVGTNRVKRTAIEVSESGVVVSDNQIYVRGAIDPLVTGIKVKEPALSVTLHDNLIRNCGTGIITARAEGVVGRVVDAATFERREWPPSVPLERPWSHRYRGWNLAWQSGAAAKAVSVIESFDPQTLQFKLAKPCAMKAGDRFEVFPPGSADWNLHDNTISDCLQPVVLDSYGSDTSVFDRNLVTRGEATNALHGVEIHGRFQLTGNRITGFDANGASALALFPDALDRVCPSVYRGNLVRNCAAVMTESRSGLWKASLTADNLDAGGHLEPPK